MYRIKFFKKSKTFDSETINFDNKKDLDDFLNCHNLDIDNRKNYNPDECILFDSDDNFKYTHFITFYFLDEDRMTIVGFLGKKDCRDEDK